VREKAYASTQAALTESSGQIQGQDGADSRQAEKKEEEEKKKTENNTGGMKGWIFRWTRNNASGNAT
jgi:ribosomal protein L12E/L44/L45/RPP1/RPP2